MLPQILTFSGKCINPFELKSEDIEIRDIAHSLACINRFNGHTNRPSNVAQHSVFCARLCSDSSFELQALLHDAAEAYVGDVVKWIKETPEFTFFRELEHRVQQQIFQKYGCPLEMSEIVEDADRVMVRFEGRRGYGSNFKIDHPNYPELTRQELDRIGDWYPWHWKESEQLFLTYFRKYTR